METIKLARARTLAGLAAMGEVIRFVPKSELERIRLVREARAIYDSIFPSADAISGQGNDKTPLHRG